jgi:hypothetical protein
MSDDSFGLRALNEALFKALGIYQPQTKQTVFADSGFELFDEQGHIFPITEAKAYPKPRNVGIVDLMVGHISAVKGGFGVSAARKRYWLRELGDTRRAWHPSLTKQLVALPPMAAAAIAERLALWERFANVPYHEIALQNGDAIANHPLSRHTWHANGGNTGVGLAIDCGPSEKLSSWLVETGRFAFKVLHARLSKETNGRNHLRYAPHRAFSAARRRDTNPFVHSEIMKPAISEINRTPGLLAVEIDYSLHTGGGLPIPNSWDSDSPFDDKGRNLRP